MDSEFCITICLVIGVLIGIAMLLKTKEKKQTPIVKESKPDDLFGDGLDHPYGIKKKNRHHIN